MAFLLVAYALLSGGCSSSKPSTALCRPYDTAVITRGESLGGSFGTSKHGRARIAQKTVNMGHAYARVVVAHELWHIVTGRTNAHHSPDPMCISQGSGYLYPVEGPCPAEVYEVAEATRGKTISVTCEHSLLEETRWAIAVWNRSLGREVFVLREVIYGS